MKCDAARAVRCREAKAHHDPRRIAHHFPPFDEEQAREFDKANNADWQETMKAQRLVVILLLVFWAGVIVLAFLIHNSSFSLS